MMTKEETAVHCVYVVVHKEVQTRKNVITFLAAGVLQLGNVRMITG